MKIIPLIIFVITFYDVAAAQTGKTEQLQAKLNNLLSDDFFESTLAAIEVYDLTEQKTIYQKNEKMLLHPASNMKILTSSAGLLFLGADYNFTTSLYYQGEIVNGTLYGDIYIKGGFDPDFTSSDLDSFVYSISDAGITRISGNVYGDISAGNSMFWGKGWMWDDDPSTDSPYLSALNINDNSISIYVKGTAPGLPAEIITEPETNFISIYNKAYTVSGANDFKVDRDWLNRQNTIIVEGTVNEKFNGLTQRPKRVNVVHPELYFITLFNEALSRAGIVVEGEKKISVIPVSAVEVYSFERSYDSVIVNLNKESDNLSAEMTLWALAEKYYGSPAAAENGIRMIDSLIVLAGMNPGDYRLVDGSGLSHYNLVTAELLVAVLKYFYTYQPDLYLKLYNSFAIAGVDGTLENRLKNTKAEGNLHGKTGTLSGVSCLSGYLTSASGNMLAFSILMQNHVRNSSAVLGFRDEICRILSEY